MEIPDPSQFHFPSVDPHSEKGKEELDSLFPPSQIHNLQVFTNPLLPEEVKAEALQIGGSSLFSSHIPFTCRVPSFIPNLHMQIHLSLSFLYF